MKPADLDTLAKGLLDSETLFGQEIKDLINGEAPAREGLSELVRAQGSVGEETISKLRAMGFRKLPGPAAPGSSARDNSWSNSSIATTCNW
jgi:hypothetical protein